MATRSLDGIFNPKSIAVVGASGEEGSAGYTIVKNLKNGAYEGKFYLVSIQARGILGLKVYQSVEQLPETVDLAIVTTPARDVPDVVEQCGKAGTLGLVVLSAGLEENRSEGRELENRILETKRKYNMRIIGPGSLGIIRPRINLNASSISTIPKPGSIAFISQSGALGAAILDWAAAENIGFSNFVSVGSMIDVNFGDLIDYFGTDTTTRSILMYIEGITNAREFMSAARHFARTKPIIVVKAGRFSESIRTTASCIDSLIGDDMVYDAAFKRAGITRVDEVADLFNCAEALGMQPIPSGPRLAIITNAGGAGIMATDALIAKGGKLAKLSQKTTERLDQIIPSHGSKGNPIDILGDAKADRYTQVVEACLDDESVEGLLIIYTIQAAAAPAEVAQGIVASFRNKRYQNKTILTSFVGGKTVAEANRILNENKIPTYSTPEQAVRTYMYMYHYKRNLELLYETPEELPVDTTQPKRPLQVILRNAATENREILTEGEVKKFLAYYDIPVIETVTAHTVDDAITVATRLGYPVALKILSPQIINKTDAGGVALDLNSDAEVREAFDRIRRSVKEYNAKAEIAGIIVQPMITKHGYEIIIGSKTDPIFGPVITFSMAGVGIKLFKDTAVGLPPLNQTLARRMMEETKVCQMLKGYRNASAANLKLLEGIVVRFSQMLVDFPQIREVEIDPLHVDEREALALDVRMVIAKDRVSKRFEPHEHLVISPYPKKYETLWKLRDGRAVLLRPIKPEDEPLWLEMFQKFSDESIRYRFFQIIKDTPHEVRVRYCNIDYDREIAIVAELAEDGRRQILGVVRLNIELDGKTGEIAFIVADPWQNLGLGTKMIDYMIEISKDRGLETIYGLMLPDNRRAVELMRKMGFSTHRLNDGTVRASLSLREEAQG